MRNSPLRLLNIQPIDHSPGNSWKRVIDDIRTHIARPSLAVLQVVFTLRTDSDQVADENPVTLEDMSGLLVFTNITQLSLYATYGFDLDDEQMRTPCLALPRLEVLELDSESSRRCPMGRECHLKASARSRSIVQN